jgi:hypothetical protein
MGDILNTDKAATIGVFTRDQFPDLSFDLLAMIYQGENHVYYLTYTFSHTGYRDPSVAEYLEALKTNTRRFLTTDAINIYMQKIVEPKLPVNGKKIRFMDGLLIPANIEVDDEVINTLVATGYNILKTQAYIADGKVNDVAMSQLISANGNTYLSLRNYALTDYHIDNLGRRRKVSFGTELSATKANGIDAPNTLGGTHSVVVTKGHINYLPEEHQIAVHGAAPQVLTRYKPEIIINTVETKIPSLGYAILGIASAIVEAKDYNWLSAALANLKDQDPGVLNRYADINGTGNGKEIPLSSAKVKQDEKVKIIQQLVPDAPVVSLDIEAFTEASHVLTPFAAVAAKNSTEAINLIHSTCARLTDGRYTYDGPIFAGGGRVLPVGVWVDNNGIERTLDDINTIFIAKHASNNPLLVSQFVQTELGITPDPFNERVAQLAELKINATLTGSKLRTFFNSGFIMALLTALEQAGYQPRFDASNIINTQTGGFGFTQGVYANAAIQAVPGFQPYAPNNGFGQYGSGFAQTAFYHRP